MDKNKPKRRSRVDQKSAEIKLALFSVGKLPFSARLFHLIKTREFDQFI